MSKRMSKNGLQPLHLIAAPKLDELLGHASLDATERGPGVPHEHQSSSKDIRSVLHLPRASKNLEPGMAAKEIILLSQVQQPPANTGMLAASHVSMVQA